MKYLKTYENTYTKMVWLIPIDNYITFLTALKKIDEYLQNDKISVVKYYKNHYNTLYTKICLKEPKEPKIYVGVDITWNWDYYQIGLKSWVDYKFMGEITVEDWEINAFKFNI